MFNIFTIPGFFGILGLHLKNPNPGDLGFFGISPSGFIGEKPQIPGIRDLGIGIPKPHTKATSDPLRLILFLYHFVRGMYKDLVGLLHDGHLMGGIFNKYAC